MNIFFCTRYVDVIVSGLYDLLPAFLLFDVEKKMQEFIVYKTHVAFILLLFFSFLVRVVMLRRFLFIILLFQIVKHVMLQPVSWPNIRITVNSCL